MDDLLVFLFFFSFKVGFRTNLVVVVGGEHVVGLRGELTNATGSKRVDEGGEELRLGGRGRVEVEAM